jgi:hypothetical protein
MTTSSLLFGAAMVILLALFISRPLRERVIGARAGRSASRRQQLMAQKAAIYAAIREIDSDVQVGKLEPADHRALRKRYVSEAVAVLKALDQESAEDSTDLAIEADISRLKDGQPLPPVAPDVERQYCGSCGAPADARDRFCARCGARLKE